VTKNTVLFDLGGTLAYYYEMSKFPQRLQECVNGVRDYLSKEGLLVVSQEEIFRKVREEDHEEKDYRIRPLEERLYRIFQLDTTSLTQELAMNMCRCFMKPIFTRGYCYEDTMPALRELRSKGFKIGLVSNTSWGSPAILWREEIDRLGLCQMVDGAVFCRDVGWRKPAKQIFEFALQKLNTSPQNCVFVGDNPQWDLVGPEAVGIAAILIDRQGAVKDPKSRPIRNLHELPGRLRFYGL
jgi:putative hydrolase of the HAD superfamily